MSESSFEVRHGLGLPAEVEFQGERPLQIVHDRLQTYRGFEARDRPKDTLECHEVGLHEASYPRVLYLDGHLPAIFKAGAMHLRDRGGGNGSVVELLEDLRECTSDLVRYRPLDSRPRLRRHAILQFREALSVSSGQEVRAGRSELGGLDQGPPQ